MKTQLLTFLIIICIASASCQKKTERCKLTTIERESGKAIFAYNDNGRLISSRYELSNGETARFDEYLYDSKSKPTHIFITGKPGDTSETKEEVELHYDSDEKLTMVIFYFISDSKRKSFGPPTKIVYSDGQVSGYKREFGNSAFEVKYLDFKKGNFHRMETWETIGGNPEMTSHKIYTFDNNCNPNQGTRFNSIPTPSELNDNNILTTEVYKNGKLEEEITNTYEYKRRMPVSVAVSSSTGYESTGTMQYSCWE